MLQSHTLPTAVWNHQQRCCSHPWPRMHDASLHKAQLCPNKAHNWPACKLHPLRLDATATTWDVPLVSLHALLCSGRASLKQPWRQACGRSPELRAILHAEHLSSKLLSLPA